MLIPSKFFSLIVVVFSGFTCLAHAADRVPQAGTNGPLSAVGKSFVYKTVSGQDLHLYISAPTEKSSGLHSAIVFFHGGGWTSGSVTQFNPQSLALAARGMVAIDVEYRLIPKSDGTQPPRICVEDAKSAIRWVRKHAKEWSIDPDRIVAAGGSAGGYLAAAAALVPAWDDPTDDLTISAKPNALVLFLSCYRKGSIFATAQALRRRYEVCSRNLLECCHATHDYLRGPGG